MHKRNETARSGFTIVELLMVIVIIGILATLVIVAYRNITYGANVALLQNDLGSAKVQIENDYVAHGDTYPEALDDISAGPFKFTDKAVINYVARNEETPRSYCITASIDGLNYYAEKGMAPAEGFCLEHNPNIAPDPPTITAVANSQTQITVSWDAVGDPLEDDANQIASSYRIERSSTEAFTSVAATYTTSGTSQVVTGLTAGTMYYFRAYSIGAAGSPSAPSTVVSEDTMMAPPAGAPTITCTTNSSTQITITRSANVSGSTSYTLTQSKKSSFSTTDSTAETSTATMSTGATTLSRSGLDQGSRYYFKLASVNAGGTGPNSIVINCITKISTPDSPSVSVSIPGSTRAASSGPWAKSYDGDPSSGNWYYAKGTISSSTCPAGTTREARATIQYNDGTSFGPWTSFRTASTFYGVQPINGYGIKFKAQTRCYTSVATSSASSSASGCRRSGNVSMSCW